MLPIRRNLKAPEPHQALSLMRILRCTPKDLSGAHLLKNQHKAQQKNQFSIQT
jgi:putative component of membrane protein insertase Oxa1/YidC/SpoIIIJ protein YidD